jgi:SAM-dependent methyltransferase
MQPDMALIAIGQDPRIEIAKRFHYAVARRFQLTTPAFELENFKLFVDFDARGNPYLSQVLLGRFSRGVTFPWLTMPPVETLPAITFSAASMCQTLQENPGRYDFVHLSNILDWLPPEEAMETLSAAYRSLRRGGLVLIRQFNIFDRLYKELLEIGESA